MKSFKFFLDADLHQEIITCSFPCGITFYYFKNWKLEISCSAQRRQTVDNEHINFLAGLTSINIENLGEKRLEKIWQNCDVVTIEICFKLEDQGKTWGLWPACGGGQEWAKYSFNIQMIQKLECVTLQLEAPLAYWKLTNTVLCSHCILLTLVANMC